LIEGFPNALLEAILLSVPALATDVGGSPEVLADRDLLFDPGSPETGVKMLLAAIADPHTAAARADRARRRALELFTTNRTTSTWLSLYDRCWGAQA
jgi:glycosyltransferase involved in cell wall biosynthesis